MLFQRWRQWRRRKWLRDPFPESWNKILTRNVAHYAALNVAEVARLQEFIRIFVAEKTWEGWRTRSRAGVGPVEAEWGSKKLIPVVPKSISK